MYLSERWKTRGGGTMDSTLETISVGGETTAVVSEGQQVSASVFGPGGVYWVPRRGDQVLVIKANGADPCIAGAEQATPKDMAPGEVMLKSQGASLWLRNDGSILISGRVLVNGEEWTSDGA